MTILAIIINTLERSFGGWLVSSGLGSAAQFNRQGRDFSFVSFGLGRLLFGQAPTDFEKVRIQPVAPLRLALKGLPKFAGQQPAKDQPQLIALGLKSEPAKAKAVTPAQPKPLKAGKITAKDGDADKSKNRVTRRPVNTFLLGLRRRNDLVAAMRLDLPASSLRENSSVINIIKVETLAKSSEAQNYQSTNLVAFQEWLKGGGSESLSPSPTVANVSLSDDTGSKSTDLVTNVAAQTITANLSAQLRVGDSLYGSLDGGVTWTNISGMVNGTAITWTDVLRFGSNTIVFKVVNLVVNSSVQSGDTPYVLDNVAPGLTVSSVWLSDDTGFSSSDLITNSATQTINATLSAPLDAGDILYGSLDGGNHWTDITGKAIGTAIQWDGQTLAATGSIEFKVVDLAGNTGSPTGLRSYVLDTTAPSLTVDSVSLSNDTGTYSNDLITNVAGQTIGANLSAGLAVGDRLYGSTDGGTSWTDITDNVNGTIISWNGAILSGSNYIVFKITDLAGNTGSLTGNSSYVLDTSAPAPTLNALSLSVDTGLFNFDRITSVAPQTISATLNAELEPGDTLEGSIDGGTTWTPITDKVNGKVITWNGVSISGRNRIIFRVTDVAGNSGSTARPGRYVLDQTAPTFTVSAVNLSADTGSSSSDLITNVASQTISATLSMPLAPGEFLLGSVDGGVTWTNLTRKTSLRSIRWTGASLVGSSTIVFQGLDLAGNAGALTGSSAYSLDVTPPTLTVNGIQLSADTGTSVTDRITNTAAQTISVSLSSALSSGDILYGSVDGGQRWTDITLMALGTAIQWTGATLSGSNNIVFQVTDLAGNTGAQTGTSAYVLDTTAPTLTVSGVGLSNDTGSSNSDLITNTAAQTIDATLSAALSYGDQLYGSVDGGTHWTDITAKASGTAISWDGATLSGSSSVTFKVADLAGNSGNPTGTTGYVLDTTPPALTVSGVSLSNDTGISSSDLITSVAVQTISASLSAALSVGDQLYGSVDDGSSWVDITDKVDGTLIRWNGAILDGSKSIVFEITDLAGNTGVPIGSTSYVLLGSAPTTSVSGVSLSVDTGSSSIDLVTNAASQIIYGTLSGLLSTDDRLYGSVDAGTNWTDITSKVSATAIAWDGVTLLGQNSIVFKVIDFAGNSGGETGWSSYVLDQVAPTQTVSDVGLSVDTGSSDSDLITNTASQTISATLSGSLATGDSLFGSVDGGMSWTNITTKVSSTAIRWNGVTLSGSNRIVFKLTDLAWNTGSPTGSSAYLLDTSAPVLTVSGVSLSADTGTSATDRITQTAAQTISASLSAALSSGDILYGSVDGGQRWTDITSKASGTAIQWTGVTLSGSNNIVFQVTDLAGNTGAQTGTSAYVLDTTAPTLTVSGVRLSNDTGSSSSDLITNVPGQTIDATLSAGLSSGDQLYGSVDGGTTWTDITAKAIGTAISWDGATLSGSSTIAFKVVDLAGNTGNTTGMTGYVLDTTAPALTVGGVSLSDDTGTSSSDLITNEADQTISATLSAGLSAGDSLYGSVDGGTSWQEISDKVNNQAILWDDVTLSSSNSIVFKVTDLAGNTGSLTGTSPYVLDQAAPTLTVNGVSLSVDSGSSSSDLVTNVASQTIRGTLSGSLSAGDRLYGSLDGGIAWTDITSKVSATAITWDRATLLGQNSVVFKVTDLAGNTGSETGRCNYLLDQVAPTLTVSGVSLSVDSGSSASDLITNTASQTIYGTLSGPLATGDILSGSVDGGTTWLNITNKVSVQSLQWDSVSLSGSSSIVFQVTDLAGNTGNRTGTSSYVLDTTAPVLTVSGVSLSADTGTSSTDRITKTAAQIISASLSATLASGDILCGSVDGGLHWSDITSKATGTTIRWDGATLSGTNTIAFQVTDLAGNIGNSTGNSLYVLDTTAPYVLSVLASATGLSNGAGTVATGAQVTLQLSMSEPVTISGGTPLLNLDSGGTASYVSGSGTATLIFTYTVGVNDTSSDLQILSLNANGATMQDVAGNLLPSVAINPPGTLAVARQVNLSTIALGVGGFVINGQGAIDYSGLSVASAGDLNGDGLNDLIVGACGSDPSAGTDAGRTYVVFGKGSSTPVDLSAIAAGSGGFVINGQSVGDNSGYSIANAGDLNGDGLADLIIGARYASPAARTNAGRSYVVFGKSTTSAINLSAVAAGSGGFVVNGQCSYDLSGSSVACAGDVNGDGLADVIIGASNNTPAGAQPYAGSSYILFGKSTTTSVELSSIVAGCGGFVVKGQNYYDYSGISVASAGDVNGDGLADLIVGAPDYSEGHSYVVFGKTTTAAISLADIASGSGGYVINGQTQSSGYASSGWCVSSAGDVNGDGLADLILGAPFASPVAGSAAGRSYVVFGKTSSSAVNLSGVAAGSGGFVINGECAYDNSGITVASAGDLNGDGLGDLLLGATTFPNGLATGRTYVVYGKSGSSAIDLSAIALGSGGFVINGQCNYDYSGTLSAAGDVNGDGLADLIVGAQRNSLAPAGWMAGRSYVIFGSTNGAFSVNTVDQLGSSANDSIAGTSAAETLVGGVGDDTITGGGGADILLGGSGNDTLIINSSMITALQNVLGSGGNTNQLSRIDGGTGFDTLSVDGAGLSLDLSVIANQGASNTNNSSRLSSLETIDITGSGDNSLLLSLADCWDLTAFNSINSNNAASLGWSNNSYSFSSIEGHHQLVVTGNQGDNLTVKDGTWQMIGTVLHASQTFRLFNSSSGVSQLLVNSAISTSISTSPPGAPSITSITDNVVSITGGLTSGGRTDDTNLDVCVSLVATNALAGDTIQLYNSSSTLGSAYTITANDIVNTFAVVSTGTLVDGSTYTINAKVIDSLGMISSASASFITTIDTTAPNAPAITSVTDDVGSITGPLTSGGSTDDTNLTVRVSLTGTNALAGDTVQLYNNTSALGSAYTLTSTDISTTYVNVQTGTLLNNTTYVITAKAIDSAGNASAASASFTTTIDTTAPNAPTITSVTDDVGSITGPLTSGGSTDDTNLTVRVSLTGTNALAGDTVQLYNNTTALGSAYTLTSTDISTTYVNVQTGTLVNGTTYVITAKVIDSVGNASAASASFTTTIDTTAPNALTITSVTDDVGSITGPLTSGGSTDDTNLTVRVSLTGTNALAGDTVQLYNNTSALGSAYTLTATDITNTSASVPTGTLLNSTTYVITAKVIDSAGNASAASASFTTTINTTAPPLYLSSIAAGCGGFVITDQRYSENIGSCISAFGDINGDGLDDLLVGSPKIGSPYRSGFSYVVFGKTANQPIDVSSIDYGIGGGFGIYALPGEILYQVSMAGDLNADGLADLVVGAYSSDTAPAGTDAGRSFVVFGKSSIAPVFLSNIVAGSGGFVINGQANTQQSGYSLASAGDFNGDGVADLIVGTNQYSPGGAFVVYGKSSGTPVELSAVAQGQGGLMINSAQNGDLTGAHVAGVGDVNGDGFADLLIGATNGNFNDLQPLSGVSYVVFGRTSTNTINLGSLAAESGGFAIGSIQTRLNGAVVAGAGDVNGDGLADLLVGYNTSAQFWVVFGKTSSTTVELSNVTAGLGGFIVYGESLPGGDNFQLSSAGDVNGDGFADLIIGQRRADPDSLNDAGRTYIVFGKTDTGSVDLNTIIKGSGGFVINGQCANDFSGCSVTGAGDVNGDGLADLFVGASQRDPVTSSDPTANAGGCYVIFGSTSGSFVSTSVDQLGSSGNDVITGTSSADTLVGGAGNDVLTGAGGSDVLYGGSGMDTVVINQTMLTALQNPFGLGGNTAQLARIDGGTDFDTITLDGTGLSLDLTMVANQGGSLGRSSRVQSIECIDLTGSGNNNLKLAIKDIQDVTGYNGINSATASSLGFASGSYSFAVIEARHQLVVTGNAGDSLTVADGIWTNLGTVTSGSLIYNASNSNSGLVQLLVNSSLTTSGL